MKKLERIHNEKFAALTSAEGALVHGGVAADVSAAGCKLTISCTFSTSGGGDQATVSDTIQF